MSPLATGMPPKPGFAAQVRAALFLAVLFYALGLARGAMVRAARRELSAAHAELSAVEAGLQRAELELEGARSRHLLRYLEGVTPARARQALASAEVVLAEAERERQPERIRQLVRRAGLQAATVRNEITSVRSHVAALDEALGNYREAPRRAGAVVERVERRIGSLVSQGYRASHFTRAKELLAESRNLQRRAEDVGAKPIERGLPDYVLSYELASRARYTAEEADRLSAEVPALRARNAEALARIPARIKAGRGTYPSAVAAARRLMGYAAYIAFAERVPRAEDLLSRAESLLREAERLNSMQLQRFSEARGLIDRAESQVQAAERTIQWALDSYRAVVTAAAALAGAAAEANGEIARAEAHIRRHSRNSQGRARALLEQAKASVRRGWELAERDPVAALSEYRSADALAEKAYSAVDTSTGDGSGFHWGSGESGGGGGGPSGGFGGEPSGGFSGGPSGGSVGGGGF